MLIIPAIDLKDHHVVRLSQGKMGDAKVYHTNPLAVAARWIGEGASRIHLVDLNGAFAGKPIHFDEVQTLVKKFPKIRFEIGGGIRSMDIIDRYFDCGIQYCILGTALVKNPEVLLKAVGSYPNRIILGVDAKDAMVTLEGWDEMSSLRATELAKKFKGEKICEIIYTDISKDGMMHGMNFKSIREMAKNSPFPVIASGGFTSLKDIEELKTIQNVSGVIAGKALYEGLVDLKEAIRLSDSLT